MARREAEVANGLKDDFLATMSHELRTPLNAVLGWAMLLREKRATAAMAERGIEAIERNARIQARLIEDVLDVSRIVSGKLELDLSAVEVASAVRAAVDVVRAAADAKKVHLHVDVEDVCVISADPTRLQQVVWNLVSNAVKFTPEGGRVDVSVRASGGRAVLEVRDTGAEIPPEFLPRVFDRFRQLDGSTTRRHGGLGLGLAIARQLVELHGGTLVAKSDGLGTGATFTVDLPGSCAESSTSVPRPRPSPGAADHAVLEGLRVLVVDDDADAREVVSLALQERGADVLHAGSAADGLAQAALQRPDVLICDIGMPGTDGYAMMRELRALPEVAGGRIPAIAVTGFARSEDVRRALESGFQRHLAKPVDLWKLVEALAKLVDRPPAL